MEDVSRSTSTEWYIGAWIAWMAAMLGLLAAFRSLGASAEPWYHDPNLTGLAAIVQVSMVVMFLSWIGALVGLAQQRQWRWFTLLLVSHLLGAGIAGMVSYAGNGPEEREAGRVEVT